MFDKEFYPTPVSVLRMMGFDPYGKICLDPQSGKGDVLNYFELNGASEVLCVEINEELARLSAEKGRLIGRDWFDVKAEQISHVELIVMNPPFSNASKHIVHAWNIAPEGCAIYALCNWETINNARGWSRSELERIIDDYGVNENLGDCFKEAERTTGVEVGLIKLFKPIINDTNKFAGFFESEEQEDQADGMMRYNEVRAVVNSYVLAVQKEMEISKICSEVNEVTSFFGGTNLAAKVTGKDGRPIDYRKQLQIDAWNYIIEKSGIHKFTTSQTKKDINLFVETQQKYPFTMRNVYQMLSMIVQTSGQQFEKALVNAVDNLTKHVHENRYGVEGWKTNEGHLLNSTIIVPDIAERKGNYIGVGYATRYGEMIDDLIKVICRNEGINFDTFGYKLDSTGDRYANNIHQIYYYLRGNGYGLETGIWHDFILFEAKFFFKGTMHLKFKDRNVWARLNQSYAKAKGMTLPEKL